MIMAHRTPGPFIYKTFDCQLSEILYLKINPLY